MSTIYRLNQVKIQTGHRATATIYAHIKEGLFTKAVRIGQRSVGWPSHEVDAIVNARISGFTDGQLRELVARLHADRANAFKPSAAATPDLKASGLQLVEG